MSTKNLIRTVVILGILSWPAFEGYRLWDTTQKLHQAQAQERSVQASLQAARAKQAQVAKAESTHGAKP
jgi:hypothetical protein